MQLLDQVDLGSLLDACAGIVYVVSPEARIIAWSPIAWNRFAIENGATELTDPANMVGRNLLDFIAGEEVRNSYRLFHDLLLTSARETIELDYRCDAPGVGRELRLSIKGIFVGVRPAGLLYQSIPLEEYPRQSAGVLRRRPAGWKPHGAPMVSMCSFCKRVQYTPGNLHGQWMPIEDYYLAGGTDDVALCYSVCDECDEQLIRPQVMGQ